MSSARAVADKLRWVFTSMIGLPAGDVDLRDHVARRGAIGEAITILDELAIREAMAEPGSTGIRLGEVGSDGELRMTLQVDEHVGDAWLSRDFWEAIGNHAGWRNDHALATSAWVVTIKRKDGGLPKLEKSIGHDGHLELFLTKTDAEEALAEWLGGNFEVREVLVQFAAPEKDTK